jgi:hypothetical protein
MTTAIETASGDKLRRPRPTKFEPLRLSASPEGLAERERLRAQIVAMFRVFIHHHGLFITGDDRVYAPVAAVLIGRSEGTLRNWRSQAVGPRPCRGSRVTYELAELARWLVDEVYEK